MEGDEIKKKVRSQLGRMEGHTNVITSKLLHLYTPVEVTEEVVNLEEDGERVPGDPRTKLPDWSRAPIKFNYR